MAGRKRLPVEELKRRGTYRADRHGTNLAVVDPAGPVDDRSPADAFDQVLADGVHWLARTDAPALALLRSLLDEREPLRVDAVAGSSEARKHLRDLDKQIISLLGQLGFDPASRARLGLAEVKAQSVLEKLREKQSKR